MAAYIYLTLVSGVPMAAGCEGNLFAGSCRMWPITMLEAAGCECCCAVGCCTKHR